MQLSTITRITPEQFFAWVSAQEERYELVDGEVVMMAGAGRRHDRVVVNLTTAVRSQIREGPCQTFAGDTYVATNASTRRMPGPEASIAENYILFVDTDSPNVHLYSRDDDGLWKDVVLRGLEALVDLGKLNARLELREIYSGLEFGPKPRLVDLPSETDEPTGGFRLK